MWYKNFEKLSPRSNGVEGVSAAEKAAMRFFKVVVEVP